MLAVDVIDDGPGIPESQRQTIFERGKRLDEGEEGQGIGLAVVQDIVSSYRGKIEWPSLEEGHCVRLVLPGLIETDTVNN
jgi:two-component system sensor histidine kinase PhoQ